ncbi:hypothetical protein L218DRAFT_882560 [Marasmius fiardii PR-910]|nr:hypothetical protein L218DRAFT_882560 [Marasmius fiardii PR-910]
MENTFCVKGVVSGEAKIYLALQSMTYMLQRDVEVLKSVKGRSWERFKEEVFEQWDVDIKFSSLSKLKKIMKIHQEIDNNTSDSEFNKYQRQFKSEAEKLQKPPALLSNHSLVEIYLSAFSDSMIEKILHSLQLKLAAKLENEDATMKE